MRSLRAETCLPVVLAQAVLLNLIHDAEYSGVATLIVAALWNGYVRPGVQYFLLDLKLNPCCFFLVLQVGVGQYMMDPPADAAQSGYASSLPGLHRPPHPSRTSANRRIDESSVPTIGSDAPDAVSAGWASRHKL
jgi:hypothetical protein